MPAPAISAGGVRPLVFFGAVRILPFLFVCRWQCRLPSVWRNASAAGKPRTPEDDRAVCGFRKGIVPTLLTKLILRFCRERNTWWEGTDVYEGNRSECFSAHRVSYQRRQSPHNYFASASVFFSFAHLVQNHAKERNERRPDPDVSPYRCSQRFHCHDYSRHFLVLVVFPAFWMNFHFLSPLCVSLLLTVLHPFSATSSPPERYPSPIPPSLFFMSWGSLSQGFDLQSCDEHNLDEILVFSGSI
jgi:hypothetical protein